MLSSSSKSRVDGHGLPRGRSRLYHQIILFDKPHCLLPTSVASPVSFPKSHAFRFDTVNQQGVLVWLLNHALVNVCLWGRYGWHEEPVPLFRSSVLCIHHTADLATGEDGITMDDHIVQVSIAPYCHFLVLLLLLEASSSFQVRWVGIPPGARYEYQVVTHLTTILVLLAS